MKPVVILGIFVADLAFRTPRMPVMGETLIGPLFKLGPGGKGSNQAVAAKRAGSEVSFIAMLGEDAFANIALDLYSSEGVNTDYVFRTKEQDTGAADIIIDDVTGNNAIIVVIGAAGLLGPEHVEQATSRIAEASVFMTNFEVSSPAVKRGLEIARVHGIPTILNPAPATEVPLEIFALADYATPNETEASSFTGIQVNDANDARKAALKLREMGVGTALITLGEKGCYVLNDDLDEHIPAFDMTGKVVETTGAGDAFNGGFAHALASGQSLRDAIRFGSATAALSVTKPGTAPAMPTNAEIQSLLNNGSV
jgi:ribokinase